MRFTLYYRGPLRSNGSKEEKHELRLHFHRQLELLWQRPPLAALLLPFSVPGTGTPGVVSVALYRFLPLLDERSASTLSLEIQFLRPGPPGQVIGHAGDIDNRLKTLFDALSMPQLNQLPAATVPEVPVIYCVASDDKLISAVSVRSLELLEPQCPPQDVVVTINVSTEPVFVNRANSLLQ